MKKIMIFIDGGNFYCGVIDGSFGDFYSLNLDAFIRNISKDRTIIRVYYYTVRPTDKSNPNYQKQLSFIDQLERKPYFKVRYGRLAGPPGAQREKGTDIHLAIDMLSLAHNNAYDVAALVSGDGDFAEVINSVQSLGKIVENYAFHQRKSDHLLKTCDTFSYIDSNFFK